MNTTNLTYKSKMGFSLSQANVHFILKTLVLSLVIAISAQISVSAAVPLTLQNLSILTIAMVFGRKLGTAAVFAYLLEGAAGLPVFANLSGGAHILFGSTGGYLFGFLIAAYVVGYMSDKGLANNAISAFLTGLVGMVVMYSLGLTVLSTYYGFDTAIKFGLLPFLASDSIKLVFIATYTAFHKRNMKN